MRTGGRAASTGVPPPYRPTDLTGPIQPSGFRIHPPFSWVQDSPTFLLDSGSIHPPPGFRIHCRCSRMGWTTGETTPCGLPPSPAKSVHGLRSVTSGPRSVTCGPRSVTCGPQSLTCGPQSVTCGPCSVTCAFYVPARSAGQGQGISLAHAAGQGISMAPQLAAVEGRQGLPDNMPARSTTPVYDFYLKL